MTGHLRRTHDGTSLDSRTAICRAVPDDTVVNQVLLRDHCLLAMLRPGRSLIVHRTILPRAGRNLARRCEDAGIGALDAPVSGGSELLRPASTVAGSNAADCNRNGLQNGHRPWRVDPRR